MRQSLRRNQSFVPVLVSGGELTPPPDPVDPPDTFTGIVPIDAAGNYPVDAAGNIPAVPDN